MNSRFLILLLFIIFSETIAQYFLRVNVDSNNNLNLIIGMLFYCLVGYIYFLLLQNGKKLAIANSFWNAGTGITVALTGYLFFKETLDYIQIIGLILTIIGITLLGQ